MEFQPKTYFKFLKKDYSRNYKIGLNTEEFPCWYGKLEYTDINGLKYYENHDSYSYIAIIKIPTGITIENFRCQTYNSSSIYIESIHLYTDFLKDDSIVPEIKRSMDIPDIRMPLLNTEKNKWLNKLKTCGGTYINEVPVELRDKEMCLAAAQRYYGYLDLSCVPSEILDREICLAAVKKWALNNLYHVPHHFVDREICLTAVKSNGDAIKFVPDSIIDEEICYEAVNQHPYAIEFIKKQFLNKKICMKALTRGPGAIRYIIGTPFLDNDNATLKELCLYAVRIHGEVIYYIPDSILDEKICSAAVKSRASAIKYIKEPFLTYNLCLEAVKSDETAAIQFIPAIHKTKELCLEAVKKRSDSIQHIYVYDDAFVKELWLLSVTKSGMNYRYMSSKLLPDSIKNDKEIREAAIKNNPKSIQFMKDCSTELFESAFNKDYTVFENISDFSFLHKEKDFVKKICLKAVEINGEYIRFVPPNILNHEIMLAAVKNNGYAIRYIHYSKLTPELCSEAVKQNEKAIQYIRKRFRRGLIKKIG